MYIFYNADSYSIFAVAIVPNNKHILKIMRSWFFTDRTPVNGNYNCTIQEDGVTLCTTCTWLQATEFCKGKSLFDIGIPELSCL